MSHGHEPKPQSAGRYRPVDLARPYGLSAQAIRNYERDGALPPARRSPSGYRVYTSVHVSALRAFLALGSAHGHARATEIMRAVNRGDLDAVFRLVDRSHQQLQRDRSTLDAVEAAFSSRPRPRDEPATVAVDRVLVTGELAHRLDLAPATLRIWERVGILVPSRDPATGYRQYRATDVRDAELAHLLRRGGYPLAHIATVLSQVRTAGGTEPLAASLADWRQHLTAQGRALLTAAGRLADHLAVSSPDG